MYIIQTTQKHYPITDRGDFFSLGWMEPVWYNKYYFSYNEELSQEEKSQEG